MKTVQMSATNTIPAPPLLDLLKQILARQRHLKVEKALSDTDGW